MQQAFGSPLTRFMSKQTITTLFYFTNVCNLCISITQFLAFNFQKPLFPQLIFHRCSWTRISSRADSVVGRTNSSSNEILSLLCELQFEFTNVNLSLNSSVAFTESSFQSLSIFPAELFSSWTHIFKDVSFESLEYCMRIPISSLRVSNFDCEKCSRVKMLPPHLKLCLLTYSLCSFALLSKMPCHDKVLRSSSRCQILAL